MCTYVHVMYDKNIAQNGHVCDCLLTPLATMYWYTPEAGRWGTLDAPVL